MICIALYDEDINEAGSMETLLYEIGNRNKISVEITVFCSGEENEQKIILEGKYDLLYICTKRHVFALNFAKNIRSSDKNMYQISAGAERISSYRTRQINPSEFRSGEEI